MVLKLYGHHLSNYTHNVLTVLHEKQIPFEYILVNLLVGEQRTADYLEKQPFGQVPCIDDDGFILYESRAICRYLCAKYPNQGTPLVPTEVKAYAKFEQAASNEVNNFDKFASTMVEEILVNPKKKLPTDKVLVEHLFAALDVKLEVYDKILGSQRYLAGEEFTLADLFHLGSSQCLIKLGYDLSREKPNVARWLNDISSRPAWLIHQKEIKSVTSFPFHHLDEKN